MKSHLLSRRATGIPGKSPTTHIRLALLARFATLCGSPIFDDLDLKVHLCGTTDDLRGGDYDQRNIRVSLFVAFTIRYDGEGKADVQMSFDLFGNGFTSDCYIDAWPYIMAARVEVTGSEERVGVPCLFSTFRF